MILYGNTLKTIMYLSLPTLMMAVVQSLIPLTDGLYLNNTSSVAVAGAVGFAVPIINILTSLSQGLSVAALAILGQIFGQGDIPKVRHCASQTMFYSFLFGCCIAPFTLLAAFILRSQVNHEIAAPLFNYLSVYSLVLPFLFTASIYNAIKSATGQPEANFIRMLFLFILKLIFNGIFLSWLHLNEFGAVLASLGSYLTINAWMLYDLYIADSETRLTFKNIKPDKVFLTSLVKLAIPSMLSNMMVYGSIIFWQSCPECSGNSLQCQRDGIHRAFVNWLNHNRACKYEHRHQPHTAGKKILLYWLSGQYRYFSDSNRHFFTFVTIFGTHVS